jgi:hypothetical protein
MASVKTRRTDMMMERYNKDEMNNTTPTKQIHIHTHTHTYTHAHIKERKGYTYGKWVNEWMNGEKGFSR